MNLTHKRDNHNRRSPEATIVNASRLREAMSREQLQRRTPATPGPGSLTSQVEKAIRELNRMTTREDRADKGKTVTLDDTTRGQLHHLSLGLSTAYANLWRAYCDDVKEPSLERWATWVPSDGKGLTLDQQAMTKGPPRQATQHSRVWINETLFRTAAAEAKLKTNSSGIAVSVHGEDESEHIAFGVAQQFLTAKLYDDPSSPSNLVVRGTWFEDGGKHRSGLKQVTAHDPDSESSSRPFSCVSAMLETSISYFPLSNSPYWLVVSWDPDIELS